MANGFNFDGDSFSQNGVTIISGFITFSSIKTAEWVKFLQITDSKYYPIKQTQFPCTVQSITNTVINSAFVMANKDGGIYIYTRYADAVAARFFVQFR